MIMIEKMCDLKLREITFLFFSSETAAAEEKESDKGGEEDCLEISPGTSYNEDLFPMAS